MSDSYLTITPLGGMGEIGLNCQLWKTREGMIMVDCGLMFPSDEHLGIDVVIPDFRMVREEKEQLSAIVLTHGHEDHIGALPWIVDDVRGVRIYGSPFTLALVEHRLREHDLLDAVELVPVLAYSSISLIGLTIHFFPVSHSIPQGYALCVESPVGRIVHSGDFKIEDEPLFLPGTDIASFGTFAGTGVRLLLSDSTNANLEGHSLGERVVRESLSSIFSEAPGRIVITLFSSNIQRIQEVFDLAKEYGKTVLISGKSLATNIDMARELGIAHLPPNLFHANNGIPDFPPEKLVILVTGAQGEPLSALSRMVYGGHRFLSVIPGDTVVMSSRIIPGNTRTIIRLINELYHLGAQVVYERARTIHASGHGQREELEAMLYATAPDLFVPIHGEYQHLVKHADIARACGVQDDHIIQLENGQSLTLFTDSYSLGPVEKCGGILVDGKGVGDVDDVILRERRILAGEGTVVVTVVCDAKSRALLAGPDIRSRGFAFSAGEQGMADLVLVAREEFENAKHCREVEEIEERMRLAVRRYVRRTLGRDPMIVSVVKALAV
ncbi:MAG: ribonuclease J [Desulfovibrio sp.]|nr:ribonuclease J [Desulfovibrio sp.]